MDTLIMEGSRKLGKDSKWYKECNKVFCVYFGSVFDRYQYDSHVICMIETYQVLGR